MQGAKPHAKPPAYPDGRCPCGELPGCTNVGGRKRICMANARRNPTGKCHNDKLLPNGRCRMHGGKSLVGAAHPGMTHGRRSILLKEIKGLGAHYARALEDTDLLSLHDEIALTDARIAQLFEKVKGPKASVDAVWPQVENLMENRRKLVDTESKRMKDLHAMVSLDRVMLIVSFVADSVKKYVKDRDQQNAILTDLRRLLKPEAHLP